MGFEVIHVDHLILLQAILWSIITHILQTLTNDGGNGRCFFVNKFKSRRIISVMVWGCGHTAATTRGSACELVLPHCTELWSAPTDGISWYLWMQTTLCPFLIGPFSSVNWEACEILQSFHCVCGVEKEKLDDSQNLRCFNSGFSGHSESHTSTSNISEVFYAVILAQCSCTFPKGSWMRLSN